jgi:L-amino acid N-acyltransferase YncA
MIRAVTSADIKSLVEIYNYYIKNTAITFEEHAIDEAELIKRIALVAEFGLPWLVLEHQGDIIGYAYATKWKERSAYRFAVESTVYLHHQHLGQGFGYTLYNALFDELKRRELNTVIGGITLPNAASVAVHEKLGMKKVAHFERIGFKFGQWRDVGYWQLNLR